MTISGKIEKDAELPDKVRLDVSGSTITVSGPKGTLTRQFDLRRIVVVQEENRIVVRCEYPRMRDKAMVGTVISHIKNMIHGVLEGFEYRMKVVYSHFPIKTSVKGDQFMIENFLGERHPRSASIVGDTDVSIKGDEVTLVGVSIEEVGQTAANIEQATKIRGYDPRVFQDGIYIVEKGRRGE